MLTLEINLRDSATIHARLNEIGRALGTEQSIVTRDILVLPRHLDCVFLSYAYIHTSK